VVAGLAGLADAAEPDRSGGPYSRQRRLESDRGRAGKLREGPRLTSLFLQIFSAVPWGRAMRDKPSCRATARHAADPSPNYAQSDRTTGPYRLPRRFRLFVRSAWSMILVAAISQCGWPSVTLKNDELGMSPIGNYLREDIRWNSRGVDLERGIAKLIAERFPAKSISREDAESLGAQCAQPPDTDCSYSGEISYRLGGLPHDSPHQGKRTLVNIKVKFSYLPPQDVVVQKHEYEMPDE
jgi:hypothetical protein